MQVIPARVDRARSGRVDRARSGRVDTLQGHYDRIDKSAAKTISDALRFRKQQGSWSFLVCPNTRCDGKKFVNTQSLWQHMSSKHRDELWKKLQSVLGPDLYEDTPKHGHLLDGITLSQDSDQHDIFHLPRVQDIFESLLLSPSIGIQAEPLAEMRQRKSREGAKILEDIKEELRMLPEDSTEFEEFRFAIQNLWLEFLETSALDYREIILPLARSFQWIQMKTMIDLSAKDLGRLIGCASIDIVFGKVPVAPGRIVSVEHGSEPSHANNTDHQSGDDTQTENIQPSCSDETLKDGEKPEERSQTSHRNCAGSTSNGNANFVQRHASERKRGRGRRQTAGTVQPQGSRRELQPARAGVWQRQARLPAPAVSREPSARNSLPPSYWNNLVYEYHTSLVVMLGHYFVDDSIMMEAGTSHGKIITPHYSNSHMGAATYSSAKGCSGSPVFLVDKRKGVKLVGMHARSDVCRNGLPQPLHCNDNQSYDGSGRCFVPVSTVKDCLERSLNMRLTNHPISKLIDMFTDKAMLMQQNMMQQNMMQPQQINEKRKPSTEGAKIPQPDAKQKEISSSSRWYNSKPLFEYSQEHRIVSVEHGSKPSHGNNTDHQSGGVTQTQNIEPSCSDETLKDGEKPEESEVRIVDSNSETTVDQRFSDPALDIHESGLNCAARIAKVELENKGTFSQSVKEMASTSSCQRSLNAFNKNNADKGLSILSLIIRSLCNLRHFRDKFLTEPLAWIPSAENICIAQQLYEIFISWEKNDYHLEDFFLTYMKTLLCRVDCTLFSEKLQAGTNFASEIVATILIGLHMSETCSRFSLRKETEKHVVNPITCGDCICPTHNLFGITFNVQMSCKCGECSGEYPYSALFHILDAGSLQKTKIKSFAELPVLLDEQFYKENSCEHCGILQKIDLFLSNAPHFFTIVLKCLGNSESPDTLSEVLADITSPLDIEFFCKSAHCGTMYNFTSMICYVDERYVCFARDKNRWLIHDFQTVETEDTWEHLLERFRDCKLQPEVLFFEVIK